MAAKGAREKAPDPPLPTILGPQAPLGQLLLLLRVAQYLRCSADLRSQDFTVVSARGQRDLWVVLQSLDLAGAGISPDIDASGIAGEPDRGGNRLARFPKSGQADIPMVLQG